MGWGDCRLSHSGCMGFVEGWDQDRKCKVGGEERVRNLCPPPPFPVSKLRCSMPNIHAINIKNSPGKDFE